MSEADAATDVHLANPLSDSRWDDLVARHPQATAFHRSGWLQALARTYGYEPLVLTSSRAGQDLRDGIVLCRVSSWITGSRLVSLPFADHCQPLLNDLAEYREFDVRLRAECERRHCKHVELRPVWWSEQPGSGLQPSRSYCFHELDLSPSLVKIFRGMHKDSIQRKIRRAERERLTYEVGSSDQLVDDFYRLLLITRRRQQLLPQPRAWFKNLVCCMVGDAQIRVARKNGIAIAAILTLRHRSSVIYKYGCSDDKYHSLGSMPFLFWKLIEESKESGAERIDFGRSDLDHQSLIAFKDRFGARRQLLTYYRYPHAERGTEPAKTWVARALRHLLPVLPDSVLSTTGRLLYRHIG